MPIAALTEYYDFLKQNDKLDVPDGYTKEKIHYLICLTPDGRMADIISHKTTITDSKGKQKAIPTEEIFPKRPKTTSIQSYIIEHRSIYIFGLYYDKKSGRLEYSGDNDKAKKSFEDYRKKHIEFLTGVNSELAKAALLFVKTWKPEEQLDNPLLLNIAKDLATSNFAFCLNGKPSQLLGDDYEVRKKWESIYFSRSNSEEPIAQCAVTGQMAPIARLHDGLQGIYGGQASGVNLVCFKEPAYDSYNKSQSYNSNISQEVMEKYTSAFNILAKDRRHYRIIDDMTIIFWAVDKDEEAILKNFDFLTFGDENAGIESEELSLEMENIFKNASLGIVLSLDGRQISPQTTFYILGVVPNSSRLAIRFFSKQNLGSLMRNLAQHQADLAIEPGAKQIYFKQIAKELKSPKSSNEKVPSALMAQIVRAAIQGGMYPVQLLQIIVNRVKTDIDDEKNRFIKLNDVRASIIKACINRKCRINKKKEEIKMGLDLENTNPAYLCGRLFAVLEKVQKDYAPKLNKTIKDSYFASACVSPSSVFSSLITLSNYHISKLNEGGKIYYEKLIGDIISEIDNKFPKRLGLEDQGRFILGYYHQNKALYTGKNKDIVKEETNNATN